jgi:hypothetical protein
MAGVDTHHSYESWGPGRNLVHFHPEKPPAPPIAGGGPDRIQFLVPISSGLPLVSLYLTRSKVGKPSHRHSLIWPSPPNQPQIFEHVNSTGSRLSR